MENSFALSDSSAWPFVREKRMGIMSSGVCYLCDECVCVCACMRVCVCYVSVCVRVLVVFLIYECPFAPKVPVLSSQKAHLSNQAKSIAAPNQEISIYCIFH